MKTDMTTTPVTISYSQSDSTKLASLLALAAGAMAMPQSGHADIIYTDLNSNPVQVGFLGGGVSYQFNNLPGSVLFGFERAQRTVQTTSPTTTNLIYRTVVAADRIDPNGFFAKLQSGPGGFAVPLDFNAPWNQGLPLTYTVAMGVAHTYGHSPNSGYDHKYLAFTFRDSTASGANRYGWIEVGVSIVNVNPFGVTGGPNVTIYGYAYDNTGAQPAMGQQNAVPEPTSAALIVIGALAMGAPGLRKWRQSRGLPGNS